MDLLEYKTQFALKRDECRCFGVERQIVLASRLKLTYTKKIGREFVRIVQS